MHLPFLLFQVEVQLMLWNSWVATEFYCRRKVPRDLKITIGLVTKGIVTKQYNSLTEMFSVFRLDPDLNDIVFKEDAVVFADESEKSHAGDGWQASWCQIFWHQDQTSISKMINELGLLLMTTRPTEGVTLRKFRLQQVYKQGLKNFSTEFLWAFYVLQINVFITTRHCFITLILVTVKLKVRSGFIIIQIWAWLIGWPSSDVLWHSTMCKILQQTSVTQCLINDQTEWT